MTVRRIGSHFVAAIILILAGCAHQKAPVSPVGLTRLAPIRFENWNGVTPPGQRVVLPHYAMYSTIADRQVLGQLGQLMEGAWQAYRSLAPEVPASGRSMRCYIFESRSEWAAFTENHTGEDAAIYLRVNRGGYTVGDWFVAYWIGDVATFSVAAHEGWHQYVARHLRDRLPPFLEEGLACLFEQMRWEGALPRWDLARNQPRLASLRAAVDANELYPLAQLVRMHAGQVVGKRNAQIEAFYAECWGFARFLQDAEGGRYRPALRRMLADAARGRLFGDNSREQAARMLWDPATAQPMLEHYLGMSLPDIEMAFQRFINQLVEVARET